MKLSIPLALIPAMTASAYNIGGGPLFYRTTTWPVARRLPSAFDSMSPFGLSVLDDRIHQSQERFRRQVEQLNRVFDMTADLTTSAPSFQVLSDDTASVVAVDVPGIPMEDIRVDIDDEQRLMTISGKREMTKDGMSRVTKFSRTFQIDERARLEELRATLENGVLTVRAPKDPVEEEEPAAEEEPTNLRRVPIDVVSSAADGADTEKAVEEPVKQPAAEHAEQAETTTESAPTDDTKAEQDSAETLDLDAAPENAKAEKETVTV